MGRRRRDRPEFDGPWSRPIKFRLGLSFVSAIGTINDAHHLHVLRLVVTRSTFDRAVLSLLLLLPLILQTPLRFILPGYFLPSKLVPKKLKPDWDEEFDNEKRTYKTLEPLQGQVIPVFYGEVQCEGSRALILSEVVGSVPFEQKDLPLGYDEFRGRLETTLGALDAFGLAYGDAKLDNFIVCDDRIMLVDMESV